MYVVIALEHVCIFFKVMLGWLVPDKPSWVIASEARSSFMKDQEDEEAAVEEKKSFGEEGQASEEIAGLATAALKDSRALREETKNIFEEVQFDKDDEAMAIEAMQAAWKVQHPPKPTKKASPFGNRLAGARATKKGGKGGTDDDDHEPKRDRLKKVKPPKEKREEKGDKKGRSLPTFKSAKS